jgi:hypothetical protein
MSHSAQKICYILVPFDGQYKLQCQLTYIVLEELLTRLSPKKTYGVWFIGFLYVWETI